MSEEPIILKKELLQVLDTEEFIDIREITNIIGGSRKRKVYYLLSKWNASEKVIKREKEKIVLGGTKNEYKLSSKGRLLLDKLTESERGHQEFDVEEFIESITLSLQEELKNDDDLKEKLKGIQDILNGGLKPLSLYTEVSPVTSLSMRNRMTRSIKRDLENWNKRWDRYISSARDADIRRVLKRFDVQLEHYG